jgi:NADH-quinone oxidoreductase subunit D
MRATLDGEVVLDMEPVIGYLHRGIEKLMEERTYTGIIPLTDRMDYASAMNNNFAYCTAVEKLAGIKVPERAEYIRVITAEMIRMANHCLAVGAMFNDAGALGTPFFYLWIQREKIYDLLEMLCGQRVLHNYMRIGGVSQDIPEEFLPAVEKLMKEMTPFLDEFDTFVKGNEIFIVRSKGVGVLTKEQAINCGISGPVARGSGVKRDLRKDDTYSVYSRFEFDIPTGQAGDCYDRYRVRIEEMRQSVRIIQQAIKQVPGGPYKADVPQLIRPPAGDAYGCVEGPKGELGFYIVSDNSIAPYRCHVRAPSLINITALRQMVKGWKVADMIVIFGSIDITMGEMDR